MNPSRDAGIRAVVENLRGYLNDLDKMAAGEKDLRKNLESGEKAAGNFGKSVGGIAVGVIAAELAMKALSSAMKFGVGNAMQFEAQMDQVGAVALASKEEMKGMSDEALRIGRDTKFGATEAAAAMEILAANGILAADIMGGAADAAANLAAAGGTSLPQAADTVSTAMAVWNLKTEDMTDAVNRLAGAANVSRFGVEDMSAAIAMGGGAASAAGVEFGDFTATIAAIAPYFKSGADAGTSLKTMLTRLSPQSKEAKEEMQALGIITEDGSNRFFDAAGNVKSMAEITGVLNETLGGLSEQQRIQAASTLFGTDSMRAALGIAKLTEEQFAELQTTMGNTDAADIARQRMSNLDGQMTMLKASLELVGISIGNRLIPALTTMAKGATTAVNAFDGLPPATQNLLLLVAAASTLALVMPKLVGVASSVITSFTGVEGAANRARLATLAWTAAIAGLVIGLDYVLTKTTGEGLLTHIMGNAEENQRNKKTLEEVKLILDAFPDTATRVDKLTESLLASAKAYPELEQGALQMLRTHGRLSEETYRSADAWKQAEADVRVMAQAMKENGATVTQLMAVYDQLPPELQEIFDAQTDVVAVYRLQLAESEKLEAEMIKDLKAQRDLTDAVEEAVEPVDTLKYSFEKWADALEDDDKWMKNVSEGLDRLIGQFAATNPEVQRLTANNAFLKEAIEDLEAAGDSLNEAQKELLESYKKQVEANDLVIAGHQSNEQALKGAKDALVSYMGPTGLGNLLQLMGELKVADEDQIYVLSGVNDAYNLLAVAGVPAALDKFAELKGELSPEVWEPIADAAGPGLVSKIREGYEGPEMIALLDAAEKLGLATPEAIAYGIEAKRLDVARASEEMMIDAMLAATLEGEKGAVEVADATVQKLAGQVGSVENKGLADDAGAGVGEAVGLGFGRGIDSPAASAAVTAAATRLVNLAKSVMQAVGLISSPSKLMEEEIGIPLAQGVAVGLTRGFDSDILPALEEWGPAIQKVIKDKGSLGLDAIQEIFDQARKVIETAPLSDAARAKAMKTLEAFTEGFEAGEGVPAKKLATFLEGLVQSTEDGFTKLRTVTGPKLAEWLDSITQKLTDKKPETEAQLHAMVNSLASIMKSAPMGEASRTMVDAMIEGLRKGIESGGGLAVDSLTALIRQLVAIAEAGAAEIAAKTAAGGGGSTGGGWTPSNTDLGAPESTLKQPGALQNFRNASWMTAPIDPNLVTAVSSGSATASEIAQYESFMRKNTVSGIDVAGLLSGLQQGWWTGFDLTDAEKALVNGQYANLGKTAPFPGFKLGTPYVPEDMLAMVHKGEAIIPASMNAASSVPYRGGGSGGGVSVVLQFSGNEFTGSPEENAEAILRIVDERLSDTFGREAFLSGVKVYA